MYIDELAYWAIGEAAFTLEANIDDEGFVEHMDYLNKHKIKREDIQNYLKVELIVADRDFFIIYISDFLDQLVWPVHIDNSDKRISKWKVLCGDWPAAKDDILKFYLSKKT